MTDYGSEDEPSGLRLLGFWVLFMLGCGAAVVALMHTIGQVIVGIVVVFGLAVSYSGFKQRN